MKSLLSIVSLCCFSLCLSAQTVSDSLRAELDQLTLSEIQQTIVANYENGQFQEGLPITIYFRDRVATASVDSQFVHRIASYNLIGLYQMNLGNFPKSLEAYRSARDIARDLVGIEHPEYIIQVGAIALVLKNMGLYEQALPLSEEGLQYQRKQAPLDTANYLTIAKNHAILLSNLDRRDECLAMWAEIVPMSRQYNALGMGHANTLYNAAATRERYDMIDGVVPYYQEAATIIQEVAGRNHFAYSVVISRLSEGYYREGKLDSALLVGQESLQLTLEQHPEGHDRIPLRWSQVARYQELLGEIDQSATSLLASNHQSNVRIGQQFEFLSEEEQRGLLQDIHYYSVKLQSFALRHPEQSDILEACFDNQLRYKSLLLSNRRQLRSRLEQSGSADLLRRFAEWEKLYQEVGRQLMLSANERDTQLDSLRFALAEMESRLANDSPIFRNDRSSYRWQDIQAQLQAGEIALEFAAFEYYDLEKDVDSVCYVVYSIQHDSPAPVLTYLFAEKEVPKLSATRSLYRFENEGESSNLHELVFAPLAEQLAGITTIYYSPDGLLHRVNIGAIPISATETMSDAYQLVQLSSTRMVKQEATLPPDRPQQALLIGGIDYEAQIPTTDEQVDEIAQEASFLEDNAIAVATMGDAWRAMGGDDWTFLPWTNTEVKSIQQLLSTQEYPSTVLTGIDATEEAFKEQLSWQSISPRIVHLATHGYFFPEPKDGDETLGFQGAEEPLIRSGLIMAGANQFWRDGLHEEGKEDGILTAYEIAQLNLNHTELVVLSACETGLGDIQDSEGVYGLQRAFKLAGTRYVLMSLWSVSDRQTQEFMTLFYSNWLQEGMSIPAAYQVTQNELCRRYRLPFNPTLWAGFVLME